LAGVWGEWDGNDSAVIRPDERQTRALIQHARSNYEAGVTHAESERAVHPRQRADLEGHALTGVIDDPNIARRIIRVDALAHYSA
jgi:hypothetical protein